MKISFTTMATPELNIEEAIAVAKEYGFRGIDFRMEHRGQGEISNEISAEVAQTILDRLGTLEISSLLCYNKMLRDGNDEMISSILECIHAAVLLKVPMIRLFVGRRGDDEDTKTLIEVFKEVLRRDNSDVVLMVQNHKNIGVTLSQAMEICRAVDDPRMRIVFSPEHAIREGQEYESILAEMTPYIAQLYIADIDRDGWPMLTDDGIVDFDFILKTLQSNGFDGYVTLKWEKCWKPELADYPEAFDAFLQWVDRNQ